MTPVLGRDAHRLCGSGVRLCFGGELLPLSKGIRDGGAALEVVARRLGGVAVLPRQSPERLSNTLVPRVPLVGDAHGVLELAGEGLARPPRIARLARDASDRQLSLGRPPRLLLLLERALQGSSRIFRIDVGEDGRGELAVGVAPTFFVPVVREQRGRDRRGLDYRRAPLAEGRARRARLQVRERDGAARVARELGHGLGGCPSRLLPKQIAAGSRSSWLSTRFRTPTRVFGTAGPAPRSSRPHRFVALPAEFCRLSGVALAQRSPLFS